MFRAQTGGSSGVFRAQTGGSSGVFRAQTGGSSGVFRAQTGGSSGGIRPKSGGGVTRNGTSHSGAGRAIGGENTKSSLPRQLASLAAGFIPVVGDVKDAQEVLTGKDLITKEKLSAGERLLTAAGALIPVVSGKVIRAAGKAGGELAGEVMKHGDEAAEVLLKRGEKAADLVEEGEKATKKLTGLENAGKQGEKILGEVPEKAIKGGLNSINNLDDLLNSPNKLAGTSGKELYNYLIKNGYDVKPLGKGSFKGIPFEEGGGFKVNWGGDRILQYHPESFSHHGGAYFKISSGETGTIRIDLDGNVIH